MVKDVIRGQPDGAKGGLVSMAMAQVSPVLPFLTFLHYAAPSLDLLSPPLSETAQRSHPSR